MTHTTHLTSDTSNARYELQQLNGTHLLYLIFKMQTRRRKLGDNDVHDAPEPENFFLSHPLADWSNAFLEA